MALGLGLGIGLWGKAAALDVDVVSWESRIIAAGGTVSSATLTAARAFAASLKAAGIWTRVSRMNLFAGDQLTACLVPLIVGAGGATDTNVNFVSGDYTEATGLQGGATKYLDTGAPFDGATGGLSFYLRDATSEVEVPMGRRDAANAHLYRIFKSGGSGIFFAWGATVAATLVENPTAAGFYHGIRTGATSLVLYRNGSSIASDATSVTPTALAQNMYVMGNNAGGSLNAVLTKRSGGYAIDNGTMSVGDETTWRNAWQTFQTALGRAV